MLYIKAFALPIEIWTYKKHLKKPEGFKNDSDLEIDLTNYS